MKRTVGIPPPTVFFVPIFKERGDDIMALMTCPECEGGGILCKLIVTIIIWVVGIVCVFVMKKIEPNNKIYPVWALFIALAFTCFALYDWLS